MNAQNPPSPNHRPLLSFLLVESLFLAYFIILTTEYPLPLGYSDRIGMLVFASAVTSFWIVFSWTWWCGTLIAPVPIFLLSAIAFHLGQIFLALFDRNTDAILNGVFGDDIIDNTLLLTNLGLLAFHLGSVFGTRIWRTRSYYLEAPHLDSAMIMTGASLLIVAFPFWLQQLTTNISVVRSGGYFSLYQQEIPVGLAAAGMLVSQMVIPGALLLSVGGRSSPLAVGIGISVVLSVTVSQLYLGYRAFAIWPLIGLLWAFDRAVFRIPRLLIAGASATLLLVVFPAIRVVRDFSGADSRSFSSLREAYASIDNPLSFIFRELGGSLATLAYTLQYVPKEKPFEMGWGYLYGLSTIVPNFFWDIHPAIKHGTASDWLINRVDPTTAELGGGLGFSFIGEAYYNFGFGLGIVALFVIGLTLSLIFSAFSRLPGFLGVAASAILLTYLSHYARGEMASWARPLVWYVIFPVLVTLLIGSILREHRRRGFHSVTSLHTQ